MVDGKCAAWWFPSESVGNNVDGLAVMGFNRAGSESRGVEKVSLAEVG